MTKKIYLIILILFSLSINQYYGYRGVFPIDSFTTFDAGYHTMLGYHPFKDYWIITGPLLNYIQSIFFILLGVNWFSYALHASVLNMILALFSFYFFSKLGLNYFLTFIYSFGIALLAYPSIGTPFVDHHASIFSIMSLYSLILGIYFKKNLFWFLIPIFLTFSFFSKQIPSSYLFLVFSITIFYFLFFSEKRIKKTSIIYTASGCIFSALSVLLIFYINEIPIKNFLTQYIYYPLSVGASREKELVFSFSSYISQFKFIYIAIAPLILISFFLFREKKKNINFKKDITSIFVFFISILIFIYYQLITLNQNFIFFLIPICLGFVHIFVIKYYDNKYLSFFLLVILIFSVTKYHIRFNQDKKFMELENVSFDKSVDARQLDASFRGLKWITPMYKENPSQEVELLLETKNILSKNNENKIIISDYMFFSAILKNKFASPNKFYDKVSVPTKDNDYYIEYKNFFLERIKENNIKKIYFVGKHIYEMSFFEEFIKENKCLEINELNELLAEFDINNCKF